MRSGYLSKISRVLGELHRDLWYLMMGKGVSVAGADREEAPGPKPEPLGCRLRLRHQPPRSWQLLILQRWIGVPDFRATEARTESGRAFSNAYLTSGLTSLSSQAKGVFQNAYLTSGLTSLSATKGVFQMHI